MNKGVGDDCTVLNTLYVITPLLLKVSLEVVSINYSHFTSEVMETQRC